MPRCATEQLAKLTRLRSERDAAKAAAALAALSDAAAGNGNLLAASVEAARAGATVGEMSDALERVFGRHVAEARALSGVYKREMPADDEMVSRAVAMAVEFRRNEGRPPRILVAKLGQDGHDRGQKVVASALTDLGFDVVLGPLFATPEEAAREAAEKHVHAVGISTLAAGHLVQVPALQEALKAEGLSDLLVVVGGVVPPQDYAALEAADVAAIFAPGTVIAEAAVKLLEELNRRLGYAQRTAAE